MRKINAHWVWIGSSPPDYLLSNISYFRALDSGKLFTYNIWLDRNFLLPPNFPREGIKINNLSDVFDMQTPFTPLFLVKSYFLREKSGAYKNYAAASDIARYAIMYATGGVYMDADAK